MSMFVLEALFTLINVTLGLSPFALGIALCWVARA